MSLSLSESSANSRCNASLAATASASSCSSCLALSNAAASACWESWRAACILALSSCSDSAMSVLNFAYCSFVSSSTLFRMAAALSLSVSALARSSFSCLMCCSSVTDLFSGRFWSSVSSLAMRSLRERTSDSSSVALPCSEGFFSAKVSFKRLFSVCRRSNSSLASLSLSSAIF